MRSERPGREREGGGGEGEKVGCEAGGGDQEDCSFFGELFLFLGFCLGGLELGFELELEEGERHHLFGFLLLLLLLLLEVGLGLLGFFLGVPEFFVPPLGAELSFG